MPKLLVYADYTADGLHGLLQEGAATRVQAVRKAVESLGGQLEAFYWSFSDHHVVGIVDVPDNAAMAGLSLAIMRSGQVRVHCTPLLTSTEVDAGMMRGAEYRPPGG